MGTDAARFEVVAGNAGGMSIVVDDELVIGRHAEGAGRLADDQEISRTHARVMIDGAGFLSIEDLGSTNGTFVNGLRVTTPQTLSEGDTIEMGTTTLVVREVPELNPMSTRPPMMASTPQIQETASPVELPPPSGRDDGRTPSSSWLLDVPPSDAELTGETPVQPPRLSLRIDVDFAACEAQLRLDEASEPVRLVFESGAWRVSPSHPD